MAICGRHIAVKVFECRHTHVEEPFLELNSVIVDEREAAVVLEIDGVDITVQWDRPSCLNVVVSADLLLTEHAFTQPTERPR